MSARTSDMRVYVGLREQSRRYLASGQGDGQRRDVWLFHTASDDIVALANRKCEISVFLIVADLF